MYFVHKLRRLTACALCICAVGFLSGCSSDKVVITTLPSDERVLTVGKQFGSQEELQIYLDSLQKEYESVYGAGVWTLESGDSLKETVRSNALERLTRVKVLNQMASDKGAALTEEEQTKAAAAASEYLSESGQNQGTSGAGSETAESAVTVNQDATETDSKTAESAAAAQSQASGEDENLQPLILKMYDEYALALQMYDQMLSGYSFETSDEDARVVTCQSILIKTYTTGEDGKRIEYTSTQKAQAKQKAEAILKEIRDGMENNAGISFDTYIAEYNEGDESTYNLSADDKDQAFVQAAFSQEENVIGDVVECADGYRIIKVLSAFDETLTEENREKITQERKDAAFEEQYDPYLKTLDYNLVPELWAQVQMKDSVADVPDFFEIYSQQP